MIGGQENKTQVMNIAVHFAGFERSAVAFGLLPPLRVARTAMEDPHHAGKEAVAPVRPGFAVVPPAPLLGVHGVEVGVAFDESANLVLREIEGLFKGWLPAGGRAEFDHESQEFSRISRDRQFWFCGISGRAPGPRAAKPPKGPDQQGIDSSAFHRAAAA